MSTETEPDLRDAGPTGPVAPPSSASGTGVAPGAPVERLPRTVRGVGKAVMDRCASFGTTCLILLGLMLLTFLGTRAQTQLSLVEAQKKYFDSWFFVESVGPLSIWLPGAYLLLSLLFANLICGGLLRLRIGRRTVGILITHLGMLFLLVAGFVKFHYSTNGSLKLWPGEQASQYMSFHEFELAIGEHRSDGSVKEYLVPGDELAATPVLRHRDLPFEVVVLEYRPNATLRRAPPGSGIDGISLVPLPPARKDQREIAGAILEVRPEGAPASRGLVWAVQQHPWTVRAGGRVYTFDLRLQLYDLPYAIRLEQFRKEEHPGVDTPRHFSSDVTKIEDGTEQAFHITMNEPMRSGGFIFSQNNWGPQEAPGPWYTVLEVSSNPSDQWPKLACYVIAVGLLLHFLEKLVRHIRRQNQILSVQAAPEGAAR